MSIRIIAGERKGALLRTPEGPGTRPTLGRIRTSLFMILMAELPEAQVLDAFAGSGALGLEALSRGAVQATFAEQAEPALEMLRANIRKLRWEDRTQVMAGDALAYLQRATRPAGAAFSLVFLDPPYGLGLCEKALGLLAERGAALLAPEAIVVAEIGRGDVLAERYGALVRYRESVYSQTRIAFYRNEP